MASLYLVGIMMKLSRKSFAGSWTWCAAEPCPTLQGREEHSKLGQDTVKKQQLSIVDHTRTHNHYTQNVLQLLCPFCLEANARLICRSVVAPECLELSPPPTKI
eukprot:4826491-Amphidinium_carterae.1